MGLTQDETKPQEPIRKISRRQYIRYAAGGIAAVALGGLGYYTILPTSNQTQPTSSQTETAALNLYAPTVRLKTDPSLIAALEGQTVRVEGQLFDQDKDDLQYTLQINGRSVSQGIAHYSDGYQKVLYATRPDELRIGRNDLLLSVSDGHYASSDEKSLYVDEAVEHSQQELKVPIKGIVYTTAVFEEFYQLPPTEEQMKEHLQVIRDELGCNGIRITGDADDVSYKCAEMAIDMGYECIVLSPFWINKTAEETVSRMLQFSKQAEELRSTHDGVQLNLVEEPSTTPRGILDDAPYWKVRTSRVSELWAKTTWHEKYQKFLRDLIDASTTFNGKKLVGVGMWEWQATDWSQLDLDILGDSHYWYSRDPDYGDWKDPANGYLQHIDEVRKFGKPYYITEWGSCSMKDGWVRGSDAWRDTMNAVYYADKPAEAFQRYYDEDDQANALDRYIYMFNTANDRRENVDAIFLHEFWCNQDFVHAPLMYGITRRVDNEECWSRKKAFFSYASASISRQ